MPHYTLDMSSHVKIWFSPNLEVFMPELHQWRLRDLRERYPDIKIALIYSEWCLDAQAQKALVTFCCQYRISAYSLEKDKIFTMMCGREGYQLYTDALAELAAFRLKKGGNLASASDLVRWLIPTLRLGVYSDIDVNITVKSKFRQLQFYSDTPLLLNIGKDNRTCWNDIIAFLGDHQERSDIYKIHASLKKAYREPVAYLQGNIAYFTECDYFFGDALALLFNSEAYVQVVQTFTVPKLRQWIEDHLLKNSEIYMYAHHFMRNLLECENHTQDAQLFFVLEKKRILREHLESGLIDNVKKQELIQYFLSIENVSDFLESYFSYVQQQTRIGLVTYFSGAPHFMCLKENRAGMAKFAFWRQGFENYFSPFCSQSDLAWLPGETGKKRWEQHQAAALKRMPSWVAHQVELLRHKHAARKLQRWVRKTVQPQLYSQRVGRSIVSAQSSAQSVVSGLSEEAATTGAFLKKLVDLL